MGVKYLIIGTLLLGTTLLFGGLFSHLRLPSPRCRRINGTCIGVSFYPTVTGSFALILFGGGAIFGFIDGYLPGALLFAWLALWGGVLVWRGIACLTVYNTEDAESFYTRDFFFRLRKHSYSDISGFRRKKGGVELRLGARRVAICDSSSDGTSFLRIAEERYSALHGKPKYSEPSDVLHRAFPALKDPIKVCIAFPSVLLCIWLVYFILLGAQTPDSSAETVTARVDFSGYYEAGGALFLAKSEGSTNYPYVIYGYRQRMNSTDEFLSLINGENILLVEYIEKQNYKVIVSIGDGMGSRYLSRTESVNSQAASRLNDALLVISVIWTAYTVLFLCLARFAHKCPRIARTVTLGAVKARKTIVKAKVKTK